METTQRHFKDLGLSEQLLHSLERAGYHHPTPIQEAAIPVAMADNDLIGIAQTGTGKTLAFVLPLVEKLQGIEGTRAVILCPTREIALQTHAAIERSAVSRSRCTRSRSSAAKPIPIPRPAEAPLDPRHARRPAGSATMGAAQITWATSAFGDGRGRLHMLDLKLPQQIRRILRVLPKSRQTLMFSATMPSRDHAPGRAVSQQQSPAGRDRAPRHRRRRHRHALYVMEDQHRSAKGHPPSS